MILLTKGLPLFVIATSLYAQLNTTFAPGAKRPDGAYQVGKGVSQPSAMFRTACEMPDLARKLRIRGDVALLLVIKADGSLADAQVLKSAGYGMDESAVECVRKWRFKPGAKDGVPVDVAFHFQYTFSLVPQPTMWGAGPLLFAPGSGTRPPMLKSATIPNKEFEPENDIVLLRFAVSSEGKVGDIQPIEGKDATSVSLLTKSLSTWKFAPASTQDGPVAAIGKVLFIKGKDYFRYKVSNAFRESGNIHPLEQECVPNPVAPASITTVRVPIKIDLDPEEAKKQLLHYVSPQYPAEAKAAGVQGNVSLTVTIGKDGIVTDVKGITGPPQLISAAISAVKQWRYHPILFHGEPEEAIAVVDIPFRISG